MFEATQQTVEGRRRSPAGLALSVVVHGILIALVVVFGARQVAKEVEKIVDVKFYAPPPPPPPPPPPASSSRSSKPKVDKVVLQPTEIVQPTEVKPVDETPVEDDGPEEEVDNGVEGGVEGGDPNFGVLGGVLGGTPGGVIGGVIGGTGTTITDVAEGDVRCDGGRDAEYPPLAKKSGITGSVLVVMIIGLDGRVESAKVESGPSLFHQSALQAAKRTVCEPYRSGSVVAKVRFKRRYNFSLQ